MSPPRNILNGSRSFPPLAAFVIHIHLDFTKISELIVYCQAYKHGLLNASHPRIRIRLEPSTSVQPIDPERCACKIVLLAVFRPPLSHANCLFSSHRLPEFGVRTRVRFAADSVDCPLCLVGKRIGKPS